MKKIFVILLLVGLTTSCYDQFRTDYDHTTVAFSSATGDADESGVLGRTVVMGEGLELDFGVYLAGVLENRQERWVEYEIDPTLLDGTSYQLMPEDYYTLSNENRFIIPPGEQLGRVTIELDSTGFVNDPLAVQSHYALPFRLTGTSEDSILATQATKILVVKYMSEHAGFYNHEGTFTTYDDTDTEINNGTIENVIEATTLMLDTLATNGMMNQRGVDYRMKLVLSSNDNVETGYIPNPNPPEVTNVALEATPTTSYVSGWESLDAVNDGAPVTSSADVPRYGNWDQGVSWQWVQYDLSNTYSISETKIYWGSDGGGLMPPTDSYLEYRNLDSGTMVEIPGSTLGHTLDQFNTVEFDPPIVTDQIRVNMIGDADAGSSTSIVEWEVYGIPAPINPEQAEITSVELTGDGITFDEETFTFTLNYRVNFVTGNYTVVTSTLTWRNRIRDGINEWRR